MNERKIILPVEYVSQDITVALSPHEYDGLRDMGGVMVSALVELVQEGGEGCFLLIALQAHYCLCDGLVCVQHSTVTCTRGRKDKGRKDKGTQGKEDKAAGG